MHCCQNCFNDKVLKDYIESQSTIFGKCSFCNSLDIKILQPKELIDYFQPLFQLYRPNSLLPIKPQTDRFLFECLKEDWDLFSISDEDVLESLILSIAIDDLGEYQDIIYNPCDLAFKYDPYYIDRGKTEISNWENFVNEIKEKNRFFVQQKIELDILQKFFKLCTRTYHPGKIFFRARTCDEKGISKDSMGKPPAKLTTSGRANPRGIPYLYLSNDRLTTLYETRAYLFDYISIAEFKIVDKIEVVNLRKISKISPFAISVDLSETDLSEYIAYREYLKMLEREISKPLRRTDDNELDYLPTQYLSEFIKSLGYDGVEYNSALNLYGFNIALFSDSKVTCKSVSTFEVNQINFQYQLINNG